MLGPRKRSLDPASTETDSGIIRLASHRVSVVDALSVAEFERAHVVPRQPVVLRGLGASWPALGRYSLEHLRDTHGHASVTVARVTRGRVVWDEDRGLLHEKASLGEFIDTLRAGARDRYVMAPMDELPASLAADLPPPPHCAGARWKMWVLWIGAAGTVSSMHRDLADNLHTQITGRKRFTLVSPEFDAAVYPHRLWDSVPNGCRVDIENPDFARFPKLRGVHTRIAELEPGDAIYIPRSWWHHVRSLEDSISANFWWAGGARAALVQAADWFKRVRGISR